MCQKEQTHVQWNLQYDFRVKGVIPSSQVTSAGLYALWRIYDIITYAETFELCIKQNKTKQIKY